MSFAAFFPVSFGAALANRLRAHDTVMAMPKFRTHWFKGRSKLCIGYSSGGLKKRCAESSSRQLLSQVSEGVGTVLNSSAPQQWQHTPRPAKGGAPLGYEFVLKAVLC